MATLSLRFLKELCSRMAWKAEWSCSGEVSDGNDSTTLPGAVFDRFSFTDLRFSGLRARSAIARFP